MIFRFLVLLVLAGAPLLAQAPRLTVLIVAEQFRADYLDRYRSDFSEDGLRRLQRDGATFPRVRYRTVSTWSAPGAATLATGAWPSGHGIVADAWYDEQEGRVVRAAEGPQGPGPSRLVGSTLADELGLASGGRSRTVVISGDAAPAALLAGRRPRGCYWQGESGAWQTSPYFAGVLPPWVQAYQAENPLSPAGRRVWMAMGAQPDAPPLRQLDTEGFLDLYRSSPFAIDDLFAFALAAIENERLGQREYPDLLILNLSAPARLALETGSESPLMRDMILRLDAAVGRFLGELDRTLGLETTVVAFTGLHGAPPQRETARRAGFVSGAIAGGDLARSIHETLLEGFGRGAGVAKYVYPFVSLTSAQRARPARAELLDAAGRAALQTPGVAAYFAPEIGTTAPALLEAFRNTQFPGRSGDLILAYRPYHGELYGDGRGVSPGSPYRYDAETPLILFGAPFRAGRYEQEIEATAIAPTLALALQIATPSVASGAPLANVLRRPGQPLVGPPAPGNGP